MTFIRRCTERLINQIQPTDYRKIFDLAAYMESLSAEAGMVVADVYPSDPIKNTWQTMSPAAAAIFAIPQDRVVGRPQCLHFHRYFVHTTVKAISNDNSTPQVLMMLDYFGAPILVRGFGRNFDRGDRILRVAIIDQIRERQHEAEASLFTDAGTIPSNGHPPHGRP